MAWTRWAWGWGWRCWGRTGVLGLGLGLKAQGILTLQLGWAGLGWAVGWWPGLGAGGRGLDLLGLGLGLEVLGPDWGAGAGAGLEGAGYPDVVGLCSTRNPMGLKHLLGGFGELSREGVRFGGSQRCLICAFNNHGTWSMSGARLRLLTQDFTRSLTGEEGGGGGRPRNWLSAKIANTDIIIANFKKDKRDHARTSVVGADSKRKDLACYKT